MKEIKNVSQLKSLYKNGVNRMKLFRDMEDSDVNSISAILTSYDLQAGSYVEAMSDPKIRQIKDRFVSELSFVLKGKRCESILEAGVGESTTLVNVVGKMAVRPTDIMGFDISWSRIHVGRQYADKNGVKANLFVGNLIEIPIVTDSVDIVYTVHSIEPNRGNEKQILEELYRITRRYLILLEPSNELGSEESRIRIEEHKYCKDLSLRAKALGFNIVEHRLFEYGGRSDNQTALIVIDKGSRRHVGGLGRYFACPNCKEPLVMHMGHYYCKQCLTVFPVIAGVPCLMSTHAILASKYLETGKRKN